jgi:hypothetical protein
LAFSGDLADAVDYLAVVDGVFEAVRRRFVRNLQPEVVEEPLRAFPLLGLDPVSTCDLEAENLDRDAYRSRLIRRRRRARP